MLQRVGGSRISYLVFGKILAARYKILAALVLGLFVGYFSFLLTPHTSFLTPVACATCDPTTCCNCGNAWTDADNDGYTVGGAVSVCFDPGPPAGYRSAPSAQPDCNDSDPSIGPAPANYGQACTTCNSCGTCNTGTIGCTGTCSAAAPALPSNYGQPCTACNACGSCNSGTYGCNGCSVTAPPMTTYYRDADGDGYGNPNVSIQACSQPSGYVTNNQDCYDSNANAHPGQTAYFTVNRGDGSFDYDCNGSNDPQYPLGPCNIFSYGSLYQCNLYGGCYCVNNSTYWSGNATNGSECGQWSNNGWGNPGSVCSGATWCREATNVLACH